jgi:hypothetical protein
MRRSNCHDAGAVHETVTLGQNPSQRRAPRCRYSQTIDPVMIGSEGGGCVHPRFRLGLALAERGARWTNAFFVQFGCTVPVLSIPCCGFDLCHKYILYLYLYLYPRMETFSKISVHVSSPQTKSVQPMRAVHGNLRCTRFTSEQLSFPGIHLSPHIFLACGTVHLRHNFAGGVDVLQTNNGRCASNTS